MTAPGEEKGLERHRCPECGLIGCCGADWLEKWEQAGHDILALQKERDALKKDTETARLAWEGMVAAQGEALKKIEALTAQTSALREALEAVYKELIGIYEKQHWPRADSLLEPLYVAEKALSHPTPREGENRCEHGVWIADHCFKCERPSGAGKESKGGGEGVNRGDLVEHNQRAV